MKKIGNFLKIFCLSGILFLICTSVLKAQVDVRADVNTTTATLNEEINLTVYVTAPTTNVETPQMPSLPNFNIYSAGQSRQVNMLNGKVSVKMQFNYILAPRFAGKATIGAFKVKIDGQDYSTEPIEVEISRDTPSAPRTQTQTVEQEQSKQQNKKEELRSVENSAANLPKFFMTAQTSTKKAYINEQVNLKIRFYQEQRQNVLGQPLYDKPQIKGMFAEDIATRQGQERFGNRLYFYTEIESALFGLTSGVAEIGSATVTYTSSEGIFDAFDMFFKGANGGQTHKVESEILFVDILPLPIQNKPSSFYGAVGTDYEIYTSLDLTEVTAGEPITLTTTVKGVGNVAAIKDIPIPDMGPSFRVYETSSNLKNKISSGKLTGTKVYKTVIVPRASGNYEIPQIKFSFFDINTKTYKTITTETLTLKVLPSTAEDSKTLSFSGKNEGQTEHNIQQITKDISYLKNRPQSMFTVFVLKVADFGNKNFYALALVLLALLISLFRKGNISLTGNLKYYLRSKRSIKQATSVEELPEILKNYLEAKMKAQMGLMNIEDVCKKLKLSDLISSKLIYLWNYFAMLKYSPNSKLNTENNLKEEKAKLLFLLSALEKEIK